MANTLSPTLIKVLEICKMNKAVTPTEINDYIGKGNYASKHVLYLRGHGYEFSVVKDGRNVASYTLIKVPADHEQLIAAAANKKNKVKVVKAKAPKTIAKVLGLSKTETKKIRAEVKAEKTVEEIKAKNLETMKKVAAKMAAKKAPKATKKKVREYDDVTEQFGTSGEVGTSFSVERDWDSVEGLDLSKLL